jgi:hypothetical protein
MTNKDAGFYVGKLRQAYFTSEVYEYIHVFNVTENCRTKHNK